MKQPFEDIHILFNLVYIYIYIDLVDFNVVDVYLSRCIS